MTLNKHTKLEKSYTYSCSLHRTELKITSGIGLYGKYYGSMVV